MDKYTELKQLLLDRTYKKYSINNLAYKLGIEKDLGFDGDDAAELIFDYSEKFGVDISKFNYKLYFTPEDSLTYIIFKLFPKLNSKRKELTIGDLMAGIIIGELNDDVINAYENNLIPLDALCKES